MLLCVAALAGCIKDNGNYDYAALDRVEISGVADELRVFLQDPVSLSPTVETTIPEADRQYVWRIGYDTLCRTKDFNYTFASEPTTTGPLMFEVCDTRTNVRYRKEFTLSVVSPFQRGWAVLHRTDGELQLSLVSYERDGMIYDDIYRSVNDDRLSGDVYMMKHMQANPSGSLSYNRMMILTSENSVVLDAVSMEKIEDMESDFRPSMTARPEFANYEYYSADMWICTICGGQPYGKKLSYSEAPEDGWYEYPIDADELGISLSPQMQKADRMEYYLGFDELNHRYVSIWGGTYNQTIGSLRMAAEAPGFDPDQVDGECVAMFRSLGSRAVSVIKNSEGHYRVHVFTNDIDWTIVQPTWTLLGQYEFPEGEVDDQTVFEVHGSSPYLFYSKGHALKALNLEALSAAGSPLNQIAAYDGEITAICHAYMSSYSLSYNELAIAIQPDADPGSAALLIVDPQLTANGKILKRYDNVGGRVERICYKY